MTVATHKTKGVAKGSIRATGYAGNDMTPELYFEVVNGSNFAVNCIHSVEEAQKISDVITAWINQVKSGEVDKATPHGVVQTIRDVVNDEVTFAVFGGPNPALVLSVYDNMTEPRVARARFERGQAEGAAKLRDALNHFLDLADESTAETFWIQSESNPSRNYKVTRRRNAIWKCECPDQTNRGGTCKHITKAIAQRGSR